jgi:hypothetical protein
MKSCWKIIYFFLITPLGFIKRLFNQDRLHLKPEKNIKSYRNTKKTSEKTKHDEENSDEYPDTNYPLW